MATREASDESARRSRRRLSTAVAVGLPVAVLAALVAVGSFVHQASETGLRADGASAETSPAGESSPAETAEPPAPVGPTEVAVPAAGRFEYAISGNWMSSDVGVEPITGVGTVDVSQREDGTSDVRRRNGALENEWVVTRRSGGLFATAVTVSTPAFTARFDDAGGLLLVPNGARQGQEWGWSASATGDDQRVEASFAAVRREVLTVDGDAVPAFVVHAVWKFEGRFRGTITQLVWYSADGSRVLEVREDFEGWVGDVRVRADLGARLSTLEPSRPGAGSREP